LLAIDSALRASQFVGAEESADGVADPVFLAGPEMAVDVDGDLRGLVPKRGLYLLHAATRVDQGAGKEVAQSWNVIDSGNPARRRAARSS
jgi:hypothetical protein